MGHGEEKSWQLPKWAHEKKLTVSLFLYVSKCELALTATLQFVLLTGLDDFPIAHVLGVR